MGKKVITSSRRICATCDNWCGERKPHGAAHHYVEFEDTQKSSCVTRPCNSQVKATNLQCPNYKKLGWLK